MFKGGAGGLNGGVDAGQSILEDHGVGDDQRGHVGRLVAGRRVEGLRARAPACRAHRRSAIQRRTDAIVQDFDRFIEVARRRGGSRRRVAKLSDAAAELGARRSIQPPLAPGEGRARQAFVEVLLIDGAQSLGDGDGEGDTHGFDRRSRGQVATGGIGVYSGRLLVEFTSSTTGPSDRRTMMSGRDRPCLVSAAVDRPRALSEARKALVDDALVRAACAAAAGGHAQMGLVACVPVRVVRPRVSWGFRAGQPRG